MERPSRPRKRRWLRWLLGLGFALACVFIGLPTLQAFVLRYRVLSAVRSAESVRLEEFRNDGTVTARVELDGKERDDVASAMPLLPEIREPWRSVPPCFSPRYRIVARDSSGQEMDFLLCFFCGGVGFYDEVVRVMPDTWRSPLERLFHDHAIPIQEWEERYILSLRREAPVQPSESNRQETC